MIYQILVAKCQAVHPLADKILDLVLDQTGVAVILEAVREAAQHSGPVICCTQCQESSI